MNITAFYHDIREAAERQGFHCENYGRAGDYSLLAFSGGDIGSAVKIYLSSGIHGDEPAGVLALQQLFAEQFFDRRAHWLVCPLLNPTGLERGTRENFQGRDLNRDYRKKSTAEVTAHCAWLAAQPAPQLALSLHEDWETSGFYLYEINSSPRPCIGAAPLTATQPLMVTEPNPVLDGHQVTSPGYILHRPEADEPEHWPEAIWLVKSLPLISCTFETPSKLPLTLRVQTHVAAVKAAVAEFLRQTV